jgi:nuclear mRNA export protein PCID2/THP1
MVKQMLTESEFSACITALSNATYGIIVLPATIQLCSTLARLAMMLDKRPDLTRKMVKIADVDQESRKTLVEGTAESIQRAFTMCLTERTANRNGIGRDGKPEGKKVGIYSFANMVLRLLFQVWYISILNLHNFNRNCSARRHD